MRASYRQKGAKNVVLTVASARTMNANVVILGINYAFPNSGPPSGRGSGVRCRQLLLFHPHFFLFLAARSPARLVSRRIDVTAREGREERRRERRREKALSLLSPSLSFIIPTLSLSLNSSLLPRKEEELQY